MARKRTDVVKVHKNPDNRFHLVLLWHDKAGGKMCGGTFDVHEDINDAMRGGNIFVEWGFEFALVKQVSLKSGATKRMWRRTAKNKAWKEVKKLDYEAVDTYLPNRTAKEAQ